MKLRTLRVLSASLFWGLITLLFLDFTGTIHSYFGWLAKIQFLPALLALNVGIIVGLVVLTLLFGRLYCSIICPLGVYQDAISRIARRFTKNRFRYSAAITWLRYAMLGVLAIAFVAGLGSVVALLEPYSAYGRIISNLGQPLYQWANNLFAYVAERTDSYAFYRVDVWLKGIGTFAIAVLTLGIISVLAWRNGRSYCNTICPVGTVLGFVSRFSIYKIRINAESCNACNLCVRNCKTSCIDIKNHSIDHSRCVSCFNCIDKCTQRSISFVRSSKQSKEASTSTQGELNTSRRNLLTISAALLASTVVKAQKIKMDGGLAYIEDMKIPNRQTALVPAGARSINNFNKRCTACQLCVSACPNQVLRPSTGLTNFMQPEMSYERGYCRPECTKCSEVCPSGAIQLIDRATKSSTQIGHAVWIEKNCVVLTDKISCGNCARHCPVGAIQMIAMNTDGTNDREIPQVNTERCIGCGACENLCPARPFSAIYVEGHDVHREV
ncbi:MAG: 4Fe-4S binding protein [Bacteroidales bacterium]